MDSNLKLGDTSTNGLFIGSDEVMGGGGVENLLPNRYGNHTVIVINNSGSNIDINIGNTITLENKMVYMNSTSSSSGLVSVTIRAKAEAERQSYTVNKSGEVRRLAFTTVTYNKGDVIYSVNPSDFTDSLVIAVMTKVL